MSTRLDLLEAALNYAQRGWPVFPCEVGGKRPLGRLVRHGFKEATCDPDQIAQWWTAEPLANVGLPTGIVFDTLDIDSQEAIISLVEYQAGRPMSSGPEVGTARGIHLYHRAAGLGCRTGILPGLDYRGRGGYVVAPPSVHPSGHAYRWAEYDGPDGVIAGVDEPLTDLPDWLRDLVAGRTSEIIAIPARSQESAYGRQALVAGCGRVLLAQEGERNHTLNCAAFSLGQLVASGALDARAVANSLVAAALGCGLGEAEARRTIASGLRGGLAQPRTVAS